MPSSRWRYLKEAVTYYYIDKIKAHIMCEECCKNRREEKYIRILIGKKRQGGSLEDLRVD
jgi:hypothetical protein